MDSLQYTDTIDSPAVLGLASSQAVDACICDASTFDQTNSLKLRQSCEPRYTSIGEVAAASEVDVSDATASFCKSFYAQIGDPIAMSKMNVMQVLAKLGNRKHCSIRDLSTFGQNEVPQPRACLNDLLNTLVANLVAVGQV